MSKIGYETKQKYDKYGKNTNKQYKETTDKDFRPITLIEMSYILYIRGKN